jgi:ribulose-phosphate 3-epimerase
MISDPDRYLEDFAHAGADSLTVHFEATTHLHRTLERIRELGLKTGVALNPGTPPEGLLDVLHLIDIVLVMTVNPGFAGQGYIPKSPEKIRRVRTFLDQQESVAHLQVDGGITAETGRMSAEAGANVFVAASAIFQHPDGINGGIEQLREAISVAGG